MKILPSDLELVFPHVLRVQASAGSGKTFLLACRFVQFLISAWIPRSHVGNMVAITFTREATAEMRRRILDFLKGAAFGEAGTLAALAPLLSMPVEELKQKAGSCVDELLRSYDLWQVRTIDSFLYQLVQSASHELGLSRQEEIETHETPLRAAAMDRILLRSSREPALWALLQDALGHYLHFQARAAWWPRDALLAALENLHSLENTYGLPIRPVRGKHFSVDRGGLQEAASDFLQAVAMRDCKLKVNARKAIEAAGRGDLPRALSMSVWTMDSALDLFLKGQDVPAEVAAAWGRMKALAEEYAEARARESVRPFLALLAPWSVELDELKTASRAIFFSDINRLTRRILSEFVIPEVVFRLGERFYHFLLDEFQDTSRLQWRNLFPLLENALAEGGSLFCVGDAKQILYRWRGSDVEVFRHGPEGFLSLGEGGLADLHLDYNWRSRVVLLDFVGKVFSTDNLARWLRDVTGPLSDGSRQILQVFSRVAQTVPPGLGEEREGGLVCIEILEADGGADAVRRCARERLVELLRKEILPRRRPGDVLVLVRDNRDMEEFTAGLLGASIPVCSQRQLDVRRDPRVREFVEILRFLERPLDDRALAAAITGRILEDAWAVSSPEQSPWQWLEALRRGGARETAASPLYLALQQDHPDFWQRCFESPFGSVGFLPSYDLASQLVRRLDLDARFPDHREAFRHLLEVLHTQESWTGGDLGSFLTWMESGPEEAFVLHYSPGLDAVRVMTIHGAKGLEAPVVVLPHVSLAARVEGPLKEEDAGGLTLWDVTAGILKASPRLRRLYGEESLRAWCDELNVLYVGFTRAGEELHLFVPPKARGQKNRLLDLLVPVLGRETTARFGTAGRVRPENESLRHTVAVPAPGRARRGSPPRAWAWPGHLVRKSREFRAFISPERRRARSLGEAVHRVLAGVGCPAGCPCDPGAVRDMLESIAAAVLREEFAAWKGDMDLDSAARTLCHPASRPLFWPDGPAEVWVEKEVADVSGELYRFDRLVRCGETFFLGEFKTGEGPGQNDIRQVTGYRELLASMYPEHRVRVVILLLDAGNAVEIP